MRCRPGGSSPAVLSSFIFRGGRALLPPSSSPPNPRRAASDLSVEPGSRESRWLAIPVQTRGSDIGSSPSSTASRARGRPGVVSAASRHARTERFGLLVKSKDIGRRYRVTIAGPNLGSTLAPDASSMTKSSLG